MESEKELKYIDTTPAPKVSRASLVKMIWRSTMLQASFNYERMQSAGWLWAMLPGLKEIHKNKEDLASSMTHNMDFFQHPSVCCDICHGYRPLDGAAENRHTDDPFCADLCRCSARRDR